MTQRPNLVWLASVMLAVLGIGFVQAQTKTQSVHDRMLRRSFPLANVMGLRDGHRAVGITNTSIPIFEDFLTPKTVVPTGNQSTVYAYKVLTLGAEPMVLEVIPDVVGS